MFRGVKVGLGGSRLATSIPSWTWCRESWRAAVAEPLRYLIATLAGALSFGGLLYVVITSRLDARGVIDGQAFRTHLIVERASAVWALVGPPQWC